MSETPPSKNLDELMIKAWQRTLEDADRDAILKLSQDEQAILEGLTALRDGDMQRAKQILEPCLTSEVPGVVTIAKAMLTAPGAKKAPQYYFAEGDLDRTFGSIQWKARQAPDFEVVAEGEKPLPLRDLRLRLIEADTGVMIGKEIRLNEDFALALSFGLKDELESGFGFTGTNLKVHSFSWEWFVVDAPGHAYKLQEEGELAFETRRLDRGVDIIETRLLKPLCCRISRFGVDNPLTPHWRLEIAKGTEIRWPSLIDGKVVLND